MSFSSARSLMAWVAWSPLAEPVGLTSLLSQEKSCDYSSCYNPASFVGSNQSVYGTVNTCARVVGDDLNQYIYTNETLFLL